MYRIDGPGNVGGTFSEGNPAAGQRATKVTAEWMNELQDEVINVIEGAGITLEKGTRNQLRAAIALLASGITVGDVIAALSAFGGDAGLGGTIGLVPAPAAGDAALLKILGAGGGWVLPNAAPHIIAKHKVPSGETGGNFNSGAWQTAPLNVLDRNVGAMAALGANALTLPAGEYYAEWFSNAHEVDVNRSRLRDTTAGATIADGSTHDTTLDQGAGSASDGAATFTLLVPSVIRIEHRCQRSGSFGTAFSASWGGSEVFRQLKLWRIG